MKVTIDITLQQFEALRMEYHRKGLYLDQNKFPGNNPTPIDQVIKEIVETVQEAKHEI